MAGNPYLQNISPDSPPNPVTPHDTPSNPEGYVRVTPPGTSPAPAPYDISAPQDIAGVAAAVEAAMNLSGGGEGAATGAGIPNRDSPRQQESLNILNGPQGGPGVSVTSGFPDYENTNIDPGMNMENPAQNFGPGHYPGTTQGGVPQFTAGAGGDNAGLPGVFFPEGSMAGSAGMDYPGTGQDGLQKYGTS